MAENQNPNVNNDSNDENDPYKFFKFMGPEDDKDKKKNKREGGRFPFWPILLVILFGLAVMDMFVFSKADGLIDFSDFKAMIENGQIVSVEIGENYLVGYGAERSSDSSSAKGIQLFPVTQKTGRSYKTAAVLVPSFLEFLDSHNVHYKFVFQKHGYLMQLLVNLIIPFGIIFLMYFFLFRKRNFHMLQIPVRQAVYRPLFIASCLVKCLRAFFIPVKSVFQL